MVDVPAPIPCPKCGRLDTDVVRLRVEYKHGDGGDILDYATGIREMRCNGCSAEFQLPIQRDDDPPKTGRP
jgi:hypothetical protein